MEKDDRSNRQDMFDQLKACYFAKTSKRVWKYVFKDQIITFIGLTELPCDYSVRVSDFDDTSANTVWKEIREEESPVKKFVEWAYANSASREVPGQITELCVYDQPISIKLEIQPTTERNLTISSWGIAMRKHAPVQSQRNWFVGIISAKAKVDLRRFNGRTKEVQEGIMSDSRFGSIMNSIVKEVEEKNLTHISISCTKGRHRSVAVAELLKIMFYPNAFIEHLTIS